jgi:crotonobetainyl-CoA:carnitine CoA-transferase CaiB-like acyl-CoA transferase
VSALGELRVLEIGGGVEAAYATKLLADLGADVCKVEPPGGDPLRPDLLFRFLNGGKRSAVVELASGAGRAWLEGAVVDADLIVESLGAGELERIGVDVARLRIEQPSLALVRISDFGQRGPYSGLRMSGLTLQATGGWVSAHGLVGQAPVQVGGHIHELTAGAFAAAAALTAVRAANRRGEPVDADLSVQECLVGTLAYPNLVMEDMLGAGLPLPQGRHFPLPGIQRCRDGWVGINALTGQHFLDACTMLGVEEFGDRQQELAAGGPLLDEFFARVQPWLDERDAQDIVELSQAFRVPAAPVGDGPMMLDYAQFRERPFFVEESLPAGGEGEGAKAIMPGPPYRLSATAVERRGPAPTVGALGDPAPPRGARVGEPVAPGELPFSGLRVLDLGSFWAGPYCTMYLGAFGADVVKIESTRRPDGFRFSGAVPEMGDDWYERGSVFAGTNLDKRDLTLELSTKKGRALLLRLVADADVVLENYSARVVEQFAIGYEELRVVKPDVIMVRMPGFGLEGPWRDYVGWAMVIEQATGMASLTGPPERPMHPGGLADPVIGMHAAVAVQAALAHRERTGEGQLIEVAQLEAGANLTAELVLEWSVRQERPAREGNRDPRMAPQGVYPCRADGPIPEWVALSVQDDEQWRALASALDRPDWGTDPELSGLAGRHAQHDELDAGITAWTRGRSPAEVVETLRLAGLPVAPVLAVPRMYDDPQLVARGYYQELDHSRTGTRRYPGWPVQFSFASAHHRRGAPTLGEHNHEILTEELGLTDEDIDMLARDGIIGDRMQARG